MLAPASRIAMLIGGASAITIGDLERLATALGFTDPGYLLALQELRRGQPNFSLAWIAQNLPFRHEADRDHYLEAFRRAGLD